MKRLTLLLTCFLISMGMAIAQNKSISGTVVDENGIPVVGASVIAKGADEIGTATDLNGKYSLSVPQSVTTLIIRFIGYTDAEVSASANARIALTPDSKMLGEVVVTALGISRDKKTLGYAVSSVSGEDIVNLATVNPMTALQGKVAGVDVSSSSSPGGTQNVVIRGFNTLRNVQPLYVIDGVPITNDQNQSQTSAGAANTINSQADFGSGINALNPNDIESISILKGSAASALYGSRAAQGVIMITTKSGSNTNGKVNVEYNGGITVQQVGRLPKEQTMFGQGWSMDRALDENGSWGAPFDGKDRVWGNIVDNSQKLKPYVYLKNRVRDFYDLGIGFNNSLSLNGGTERTKYHVSVSQNQLDGPIPTNDDSYDRYTIATNASHKTSKVMISTAFNFSVEQTEVSPTGQDYSIYRALNEIATDISIVDLKDYNDKFNNLDNYFTPYGLNPYYTLEAREAIQDRYKFFGKVQLDYDVLKNLKLTYRFGGDYESSVSDIHRDAVIYTPGSPNASSTNAYPGSYSQMRIQRVQTNHDYFATFSDRFDDISVNVIAGGNANERTMNRIYGEITSLDIPGFYDFSNSLTPALATQAFERIRTLGAYINADFGYRDYLYLTLTGRNDWSSTLPKEHNSFFYPASMVSFIATEFMQQQGIDTGILDFAKLRLAYGKTGIDSQELYGVYDRFFSSIITNPGYPDVDDLTFPLGGVNSWSRSNISGNPELKPELTNEFEVGVETSFFDQRIGFDFSYYNKLTEGLIELLPIDPSSGFTSKLSNLGDVRNSGIELSLSFVPVRTENFQWDVQYNFTKNNNKVERLDTEEIFISGFGGLGIYAVEGKPLGQFKTQKALTVMVDGVESTVVDGTGMPQPTPNEEYLGKDVNEKYRMGLTNTFTYKGFSLSGVFDFRYGGSIFSYTKDYMHWTGSGPETVYNDRNPFIIPNSVVANGDGTYSENTTPVSPTEWHTFYSNGGFDYTDFFVIDRSYLKLRNVSLAYQMPKSVCDRLKIASLRVSASASNILLWTPKENQYIDPEVTTWGNNLDAKVGEYGLTPPYQSYVFGLQVSF